jgi:hypothetical protein
MITTTKQARIVLAQLLVELPKGSPARALVLDVSEGNDVEPYAADVLFSRLMLDHGYSFDDASAAHDAVRKMY